jgi:hypothetical protein
MSDENAKLHPVPSGSEDPLSATAVFLNALRSQPEQTQEKIKDSVASVQPPKFVAAAAVSQEIKPQPAGTGEFTQMFGAFKPVQVAPIQAPYQSPAEPASLPSPGYDAPQPAAEASRRIFDHPPVSAPDQTQNARVSVSQPPQVQRAQRVKGYSSSAASDSASDDGSSSRLFRRVSAPSLPPSQPSSIVGSAQTGDPEIKPLGATDLVGPPSPQSRITTEPAPQLRQEPDSITRWIEKLGEGGKQEPSPVSFATNTPVSTLAQGESEYTRIISPKLAAKADSPPSPAPLAEPLKAPKLPAAPAPQALAIPSGLQQISPILLVINGFLLAVLIILVVFVLLRK